MQSRLSALHSSVEKELLVKLKSGDQRAFDQIYLFYSPRIYGKILRLTRTKELAIELLQDTFVKVWEKRHLINPELSFKSWLYRIAINEVYLFYRKVARNAKLQEELTASFIELHVSVEENYLLKESHELLSKAIDLLPPQRKAVFTLCKLEGRSYEEAAYILNISTNTVSSQLVKATSAIRLYLFRAEHIAMLIAMAFYVFC